MSTRETARPSLAPLVVVVLASALAATLPAREAAAQNRGYAGEYAQYSVSLLAAGGMTVLAPLDRGNSTFSLTIGATPRIVYHHLAIQPSLDFGYGSSNGSNSTRFGLGVGVGYALVLSDRVALTPMGVFNVTYTSLNTTVGPFGAHADGTFGQIYGEVPLTIFIGRNGFIEPYVDLGFEVPFSSNGSSSFFFTLGYRLGVTF